MNIIPGEHSSQKPFRPELRANDVTRTGPRASAGVHLQNRNDHIAVCICTYKRPAMLRRLLESLFEQATGGRFTYAIIVVDNDDTESARSLVAEMKKKSPVALSYQCEPRQNISLARNKAVGQASGNYVAFIDDDEFPPADWLSILHATIAREDVDGVLGPVKPFFEATPPSWIVAGKFYEKQPPYPTGTILKWTETRTSNALVKKSIFHEQEEPFDPRFGRGGEDRDFFRRMMEKHRVFIWCREAAVFESVPPERCTRSFMIRRALLRGKVAHDGYPGRADLVKSVAAVFCYTFALPFFLFTHHRFMKLVVKNFEHIGKLIAFFGYDVVKQNYVMK